MDKTIPPRHHVDTPPAGPGSFDPDKTIAGSRARLARGELQAGDVVLDRYDLLEKLGSGAMGVVFKCKERISGVEYALKMVPPELARDADAMEDVLENFKLVHGLKHPNIASVDFLERDEYRAYFLIMEYAEGQSLARWIKRKWRAGQPELSEVAAIVRQIASALDYAHGRKILHRDIKPANVMIDAQGAVKVLDFGLASEVRSSMTALSQNPANSGGTPNYLAPEQFKGRYPGPAADQYALGVLTYQMLAGHLPFGADDFDVLRAAVCNEAPEAVDGLPEAVNLCLQKVLSKDPKERYENCTAFAEALEGSAEAPGSASQKTKAVPPSAAAAAVADLREVFRENNCTFPLPGGAKMEMMTIRAGSFVMGSIGGFIFLRRGELGRFYDEKQHRVTLTKDYLLGKYEVTQGQWQAVMGNNPSLFENGDDYPVECVSWDDAKKFCNKLNELCAGKLPRGYHFDLPTEAQWEYACRAGTTTALNNGKNLTSEEGACPNLDEFGWYDENSDSSTHPVGKKRPNAWGLYDMHGNVREWCSDWYGPYSGNATDPSGPASGSLRVYRGGGWISGARRCRSARRDCDVPRLQDSDLGFRLALVPVQ